jgi:hypothetical protein
MPDAAARSTPVPVIVLVILVGGIVAACLVVLGLGLLGEISSGPATF